MFWSLNKRTKKSTQNARIVMQITYIWNRISIIFLSAYIEIVVKLSLNGEEIWATVKAHPNLPSAWPNKWQSILNTVANM